MATKNELYSNPKHPYTKALFSSVPIADINLKREPIILKDDIPSPTNLPKGCRFHTSCIECKNICTTNEPNLESISKDHLCACHLI